MHTDALRRKLDVERRRELAGAYLLLAGIEPFTAQA
jgi:hypothetical protein